MRYTFEISSIPIEVEHRNVKDLRLTVYPPDGKVRIAAPFGTVPETIRKFANTKIKWIEKHREKFLKNPANAKQKTGETLRNHSTVYIWGAAFELELVEHKGNSRVLVEDDRMLMYVRPLATKAKKMEILDRWYRRTLKEAAGELIKKWEAIIGVDVEKLYVRKMRAHWGSCNYERQTMRLNSELAKRKSECLEYVIVHEMLHIIEKSHNQKFYRLLNKYLPSWKTIRREMNSGN